jgi:hypothetical protein
MFKLETNILEQSFSPKVIDRYPLINLSYAAFPDAVSIFCFPEGVKF